MRNSGATELTEELRLLEVKLKTLKRDYEQYFLGSRPREPSNGRAEIQKAMIRLANGQIRNTGERFKFNTLNSQFLTFKRHWDDTLRKIENGSYKRHVFKANLHDRERGLTGSPASPAPGAKKGGAQEGDIFASYMKAAKSCGQNTAGLTPEKLQGVINKQAAAIKKKMGAKDVKFRVEVVDGKVKLKAKATKVA
ncbi:MAG: hypothetical protein GY944_14180 [bacterium]|nr:hypothetical protein [bacterium]